MLYLRQDLSVVDPSAFIHYYETPEYRQLVRALKGNDYKFQQFPAEELRIWLRSGYSNLFCRALPNLCDIKPLKNGFKIRITLQSKGKDIEKSLGCHWPHGKHSHNDMVDMNWAKALYEELQNEMLAIHALIKAAKPQQPRS